MIEGNKNYFNLHSGSHKVIYRSHIGVNQTNPQRDQGPHE